jgi:pyruvate formate lyase activating enzyme
MNTSGIIFDIKKFAVHDGPGIRTTVFFKGCPLNCFWCHNPEGRLPEPVKFTPDGHEGNDMVGYEIGVNALLEEIKKDRIFYDQSGGGVTFSGGEPMMQVDFLIDILSVCRDNNIDTALDTCGYAPFEDFKKISDLVDYILYDIKLMDNTIHVNYTGVSNSLILDNLKRLSELGILLNPRIPLIPDITDTDANLNNIADFLGQLKNIKIISLLPYNVFGKGKNKRFNMENKLNGLTAQTDSQLEAMSGIFKNKGFAVKIGG